MASRSSAPGSRTTLRQAVGVPLGVDVCYTNTRKPPGRHGHAAHAAWRAGVPFIMGVPGGRRHAQLPEYLVSRRSLPAGGARFERRGVRDWLEQMGIAGAGGELLPNAEKRRLPLCKGDGGRAGWLA